MTYRAIVVGGSVAGLFTGLLLRRQGWQVDIFERASRPLSDRGAGIVTHPQLLSLIGSAGIHVAGPVGVEVPGRLLLDVSGRVVLDRALPQVVTSWSLLYGLLRNSFPPDLHHFGRAVERIESHRHGVCAYFADGLMAEADLLVGADGINSATRAQLWPASKPQYAGYVAWRGTVAEQALSIAAQTSLCKHFSFCLPQGEQMLGYPIPGPNHELQPGHRRFNFVWYRPAAENGELNHLLTDREGHRNGMSVAPNRIHPDVLTEMLLAAQTTLAPVFAEAVQKTPQPFVQPIMDLETPSLSYGRVALLGDAAFVARPHVGMGATKAAGDAHALATALAGNADIDSALAVFSQKRSVYGASVVARARNLGRYMQAACSSPEEQAAANYYQLPETIIRETAVDTGIQP